MPTSRSHPASSAIPPLPPAARYRTSVEPAKAPTTTVLRDLRSGRSTPASSERVCVPCGSGLPLYNIVPDYGFPAQFYARSNNTPVVLSAILHPRTEDYAISFGSLASSRSSVVGFGARLYGFPAYNGSVGPEAPFLTNSVDCSNAHPARKLALNSWQNTGAFRPGGLPDVSDPNWLTAAAPTPPVTGCDDPSLAAQFNLVTIAARPLQGAGPLQADHPSGLALDLDFPQSNDPTDPDTDLRSLGPPSPRAQGHHRQAPGRPQHLALLGRRPRRLLGSRLQRRGRSGPLRHHSACHLSGLIEDRLRRRDLAAARRPRPRRRRSHRRRADPRRRLPAGAPPGRSRQGRDGKFRLLIELENARYGVNIKLPGVAVADKQTGQLTADLHRQPAAASQASDGQPQVGTEGAAGDPGHLRQIRDHRRPASPGHAGHPRRPPGGQLRRRLGPGRQRLPAAPRPAPSPRRSSAGTESAPGRGRQPLHPRADPPRRRTGAQLPERHHAARLHRQA